MQQRQQQQRDGDQEQTDNDDSLRAHAFDDTSRQRSDDHHRKRVRNQPDARFEWAIAMHELPVLGHQEQRAKHREERERDGGVGGGEARVAEEVHIEHGVVNAQLPCNERGDRENAHNESGDDLRVGPTAHGHFDDSVEQRTEADHREQ